MLAHAPSQPGSWLTWDVGQKQMKCTHTENVRIGSRRFTLVDHLLTIENTKQKAAATTVDLRSVLPEPQLGFAFQILALRRASRYVMAIGVLAIVLYWAGLVPLEWLVVAAVVLGSPGIIVLIYFSRTFRIAKFVTHSGSVAFDVISTRARSGELESFVQDLSCAIKDVGIKQPNQAPLPTPVSVTPAAGAPVAPDTGAAEL